MLLIECYVFTVEEKADAETEAKKEEDEGKI
jgi:hypothetical protein